MNLSRLLQLVEMVDVIPTYPDPRYPPSDYYKFLYVLVSHMRPSYSVELGVCGGGASLHMSLGYPDGKVIGVDKDNDYPDQISHIAHLCPGFEFWQRDSIEAAECFTTPIVSVLFIDTVHTYERTMAEFKAWRPHLRPGAVVCLDDLYCEGMDRAWDELPGQKLRLDELHPYVGGPPKGGGFGVVLL